MQKEKIINSFVIILLLTIFSFVFWSEYYDFQKENLENYKQEQDFQEKTKNFEIKNIKELKNIDIIATPNKALLEEIVDIIDNTEKYVYVEVYMLTESRIKDAILRAKNRWIEVKIILEKDPYLAYNINNKTFNEFEKKGVSIVWSNKENYYLNHSKIILIDWLSIISTGNLTYSSFTQNRDIYVFSKDKELHKSLLEIFELDFEWVKNWILYENLVLSPQNSRDKIEKLFNEAKKSINMYIPYLDDDKMVDLLFDIKTKKNLTINIIVDKDNINDENVKKLQWVWVSILSLPKYTMHSKAILIDNDYLFIWSVNFSEYSLDKNREIGILLKESQVIEKWKEIFQN